MKKNILFLMIIVMGVLAASFYSCSGGGSGDAPGLVALYTTEGRNGDEQFTSSMSMDDMDDYMQVTATINSVRLLHTGSGAYCDVLTEPRTVDVTELSSILQLLNTTNCDSRPYNRVRIVFEKDVQLMDSVGTIAACMFTSYKEDHDNPNVLYCNDETCTLDINGAVNVLANDLSEIALDFRLKDFDVEHFGEPSCTVTMKVSPLHAEDDDFDDENEITGYISSLDTDADTFTLTRKDMSFTVSYADVAQQGIDELLARAHSDRLKVKVWTDAIDYMNNAITAKAIAVKVEGMISNLAPDAYTFDLSYRLPDQTMSTIPVNYMNAVKKEGNLADGVQVEVKLNGYDSATMNYLAYKVEVEDDEYGEEKAVTGYISSLDTDADTFILTRKDMSFTVSYAAVTQPGIDDLLARAQSDHLKVKVRTDAIDFMNKTITAKAIVVKVKGMLSNLAPDAYTFDVFYMLQDPTKKITVYYEGARIEGQWLGAMRVEAKLVGYDSGNDYYRANKVELEDDEDKYEHDTET